MEKKNIAYPKIRVKDNRTLIEMHRFDKDVLVIAKKRAEIPDFGRINQDHQFTTGGPDYLIENLIL